MEALRSHARRRRMKSGTGARLAWQPRTARSSACGAPTPSNRRARAKLKKIKVPTKLSDGSTHVHLHMDICGSKKVIWAFDRTSSLQMYVMFFSGQLYVACNGAAITLRLPTGDRSDSASQSSTARHARERGTTDVVDDAPSHSHVLILNYFVGLSSSPSRWPARAAAGSRVATLSHVARIRAHASSSSLIRAAGAAWRAARSAAVRSASSTARRRWSS